MTRVRASAIESAPLHGRTRTVCALALRSGVRQTSSRSDRLDLIRMHGDREKLSGGDLTQLLGKVAVGRLDRRAQRFSEASLGAKGNVRHVLTIASFPRLREAT